MDYKAKDLIHILELCLMFKMYVVGNVVPNERSRLDEVFYGRDEVQFLVRSF